MSLNALKSLRNCLVADVSITAWYAANYPNAPHHYIGYKKLVNGNDYPAICYVPVRDKRGQQPYESMTVSLVVSINEKGITDDVFDGVTKSDELVQLIVNALLAFNSPVSIQEGVITVTTDLGMNHPFYDCELQFVMLTEPAEGDYSNLGASNLGDFTSLHNSFDIEDTQNQAEHAKWALDVPDYSVSKPGLLDDTELPQ